MVKMPKKIVKRLASAYKNAPSNAKWYYGEKKQYIQETNAAIKDAWETGKGKRTWSKLKNL